MSDQKPSPRHRGVQAGQRSVPARRGAAAVGPEPVRRASTGRQIENGGSVRDAPSCGAGEAPSCDGLKAASLPVLSMWVPGTPRPKQSGRFVRGRFVTAATANRGLRLHRERLEREARRAVEHAGGTAEIVAATRKGGALGAAGLHVAARFVFRTADATRWGTPHTSRPDADNLCKMLLDALAAGGWFSGWRDDDAAAARVEPVKVWGQHAGTGVELRAIRDMRRPGLSEAPGEAPLCFACDDGIPEWLRGHGEAWVIDQGDDSVE
jgi:Holliday junction resolvase RusA-like endonuclease